MTRTLIVLVLALLAPAFAADAPAPADRPGPSEPPRSYALISLADVKKIEDLLQRMTEALYEQDHEIERLRALAAKGGCV